MARQDIATLETQDCPIATFFKMPRPLHRTKAPSEHAINDDETRELKVSSPHSAAASIPDAVPKRVSHKTAYDPIGLDNNGINCQ